VQPKPGRGIITSFAAAFVIHDGAGHWLFTARVTRAAALTALINFFRSHATGYRLHLADCELYPFFVVTTVVFGLIYVLPDVKIA